MVEELLALTLYLIISLADLRNQKVEHNDDHDEYVQDPEEPNYSDSFRSQTLVGVVPGIVTYRSKISNRDSKILEENYKEARDIWVVSIIKLCIHYNHHKRKEEHRDYEKRNERKQVYEYGQDHLNEKAKVLIVPQELHQLNRAHK